MSWLYWASGDDMLWKGDGTLLSMSRLHLPVGGGGGLFLLCSIHLSPGFVELR